jgi:hypothetical protein
VHTNFCCEQRLQPVVNEAKLLWSAKRGSHSCCYLLLFLRPIHRGADFFLPPPLLLPLVFIFLSSLYPALFYAALIHKYVTCILIFLCFPFLKCVPESALIAPPSQSKQTIRASLFSSGRCGTEPFWLDNLNVSSIAPPKHPCVLVADPPSSYLKTRPPRTKNSLWTHDRSIAPSPVALERPCRRAPRN